MRKEDGLEVEDDDVLQELLLNSDKEVCLIAEKNSETSKIKQIVKVSTLNQKDPSSFDANSLKLLKMQGTFYFKNNFKCWLIKIPSRSF